VLVFLVIVFLVLTACTNFNRTGATVIESKESVKSSCDGVNVCVGSECNYEEQKDCQNSN